MRDKGKLVSWNDEKGFGFIAPFSGAAQVFIHVKAFGNRPALAWVLTSAGRSTLATLSGAGTGGAL